MSSNYDGKQPIGAFSSLQTWNTYSWINNEAFYGLVPQSYKDFYQRFVKQWFYWYDGFVPYFHNSQSGMVSTNLASAILKKLAEKTVGAKLLFDDEGVEDKHSIKIGNISMGSVEFSEHWSKNNDLTSIIKQAFEWAYAGGDSILKLDTDAKNAYVSVVRKDNYLIDTDFRGKIIKYQGFVYAYTKMIGQDQKEKQVYYLVEEREYINDKPMFKVAIKVSNSNLTNNKQVNVSQEGVPFERLPNDIKKKFKKDYPNMALDTYKEIPFEDLGIYMVKATKKVRFLPDAPFGESLLSPLIHLLMTYDFYFSSLTTNLYTTRDRVLMPQHMQTPSTQDPDKFYAGQQNFMGGMDSYIYNQVPYTDPENQKPMFIQPELRDWAMVRNNLLQSCAMILGIDDRTISSSILPDAEKPTAREISVDEDTTVSFVNEKRQLNSNPLNRLVNSVNYFYGFKTEKVTLSFSRSGLSNINNATTIAVLMTQNKLGDRKSILEMVWPDKNDKQIDNMLIAIEEEEQKALEQVQKQQDMKDADVEEKNEQQNNDTEYHQKKPKE
jgi:hypothetical protein